MNLSNLFQTIPARIEHMSFNDYKNKPIIKIYDDKQKQEIAFINLFNNTKYILSDFRTLAMIWDDLIPCEGTSLESKQIEILEWIGGKRNALDILVMLKWLQAKCDIDSVMLLREIESNNTNETVVLREI